MPPVKSRDGLGAVRSNVAFPGTRYAWVVVAPAVFPRPVIVM